MLRRHTARWFVTRLFGLSINSRLWSSMKQTITASDTIEDLDKELGVIRE